MTTAEVDVVDIHRLRTFAVRALTAVQMPYEHAGCTADAMAWAQLHGHAHHSVTGRLQQCISRIRHGGTDPQAAIAVGEPDTALAVVDGDNALGLAAGVVAMRAAITRAERFGVGMVVQHDISTLAALGYYATLAVDAQMIGVVITNCPPLVAAPYGIRPVIGNQAHAIGCPAGKHFPFLYDSAITVMSTTAIERVHQQGGLLPDGVLRDRDGQPTRDPAPEVWRSGMLSTIGGYRGFGLGLAFELLTGVLGGGACFGHAVSPPYEFARPQGATSTFIAIDPTTTRSFAEFTERVDQFIDEVRSSGPPGGPVPHIPGERGYRLAAERLEHGVPLDVAEVHALDTICAQLGIASW